MKHASIAAAAFLIAIGAQQAIAQPRGGAAPQAPRTAAPIDLTGYWVAVVTEDWRHRMATPRKGDFESLPLNAEGRRVANEQACLIDPATGYRPAAYRATHVHGRTVAVGDDVARGGIRRRICGSAQATAMIPDEGLDDCE